MKYSFQNERIIIFGATRGLGSAVAAQISDAEVLLISRNASKKAGSELKLDIDLSRAVDQDLAIEKAKKFSPTRIFYFVGGGPYGLYAEKNWRDHEWAYQVNFLFPAKLIHSFMKPKDAGFLQLVVTGSAIAESKTDENAASYSSAKHALKALVENLQPEAKNFDLRLFSPGYMDTGLLPKNSRPRKSNTLLDPAKVATQFCEWVLDSKAARHKIIL